MALTVLHMLETSCRTLSPTMILNMKATSSRTISVLTVLHMRATSCRTLSLTTIQVTKETFSRTMQAPIRQHMLETSLRTFLLSTQHLMMALSMLEHMTQTISISMNPTSLHNILASMMTSIMQVIISVTSKLITRVSIPQIT